MTVFKSEIELGKKYTDSQTGFEGTASSVVFFQHGCERVCLKGLNKNNELVEYYFDSPELQLSETGEQVKLLEQKTGGPHSRTPTDRR